jgi:hypothetical protein
MATAHADAWPESGLRGERPSAPPRRTPPPPLPPLPEIAGRARPSRPAPAEARGRSPERGPADRRRPSDHAPERIRDDRMRDSGVRGERGLRDDLRRSRPPAPRPPVEPPRGRGPARDDHRAEDLRPGRADADRPGARRPPVADRPAPEQGSRLRGFVAVLGVFLVTLAAATVDWFLGTGLGMITLVALVASTSIGTLVVRRRDVLTLVVSPPLVFVAVAGVNIALSPGVGLTLPTVATLLIRGFPTMAVATGAAIVLGLVRLISRR